MTNSPLGMGIPPIRAKIMSSWPGKYLIGLTGNIATGKSLVREMLEYLGAQGIDADQLAHDVIDPGTQGYLRVIQEFGKEILTPENTIDRSKLASIVFKNRHSLTKLESIIHPLVAEEINNLITSSSRDVLVLEAIKLIEANLYLLCDSVWVTVTPPELQLQRLNQFRGMEESEAQLRIEMQSSQESKLQYADVIIENNGSLEWLWRQVIAGWESVMPGSTQPEVIPEDFMDEFLS